MTADSIEREVVIDAPPAHVWDLLTDPEHLGTLFADAGAEIDLRPGGRLVLRWHEHGTAHGRVVAVEPHRRLAFRGLTTFGAVDEPAAGNSTLVEFTLAPEGDGTRLRVVESGFAHLEAPEDQRRAMHDGNVEGWQVKCAELQAYARERRRPAA